MDKEKLVELAREVAMARKNVETVKVEKKAAEEVLALTAEARSLRFCVDRLGKYQEDLLDVLKDLSVYEDESDK